MSAFKVVHLTSVHRPFDTRIFYKECRSLLKAGYEVVLVAPHDRDEVVEGVRIKAVPRPRGRAERMTRTVGQVLRAALAEDAAVYHFHDPELIPVGLLLRLRGKEVIYDIHEDLPRQILSKPWIPLYIRRPVGKVAEVAENSAAKRFSALVKGDPKLSKRFLDPDFRVETVYNFPLMAELGNSESGASQTWQERKNAIAYVGGITLTRGVKELVNAIDMLSYKLSVEMYLAGTYSPDVRDELLKLPGWAKVRELGFLDRQGVYKLLGSVRIGMATLHPEPNYINAYPVKLFEYMLAGIPVVISDFPLWREIVEGAGCGLLVDPLDPRAIAEAIQWLLEHPAEAEAMGRRGQEAVLARYNWDNEAEKLLALYERLAK